MLVFLIYGISYPLFDFIKLDYLVTFGVYMGKLLGLKYFAETHFQKVGTEIPSIYCEIYSQNH